MKFYNDMKISVKLISTFLILGILPLFVLGVLSVKLSGDALHSGAFNQLEAVREIKKFQIETFFAERIGDINVLAKNPYTVQAVEAMDAAFDKGGGTESGNYVGHTNEKFDAPELFKSVHDIYFPFFKYYMEQNGYYDIFLMCPDHGDTFFTVTKEADFGQRAKNIDTSLREVWRKAAQSGEVTISDTQPYAPSNNAPAQFIAAPVKKSGETVGVVAFQISLDAINKIMMERSGMGETGESYLIGPDNLMRSDSYLDPVNHTVTASFANPQKGSVTSEAAKDALAGEIGKKIVIDYNGNPVLSAYTPVNIGNHTWGLLSEIDKAEAFATVKTIKMNIGIIALVAIVLIILIALFVSRSITKPIKKGVVMAQEMANGDLTQQLNIEQADEIGVLAKALNNMSQNLRMMFVDVASGTQTLTSSSTELSAISEQMSNNSEQTSEKADGVAAAAEEMATNMNSVAAATEQTTANIQMIVSAAEEMTSTINEISGNTAKGSETTTKAVETAKQVSEKVDKLGTAANEINKVTDTIADISGQTNLLALNATIEAARAGEAGKGFAVVAGEIKALAQQTAEATNEISDKIGGVQSTTEESVVAIQSILEIINEIDSIVKTVATAIEEQSATTQEIANNVSQAAAGLTEVNENVNQTSAVAGEVTQDITQVSQATQEINDGSLQVKTSATELSELAEKLNEMIGQFKI